MIFKSKINHINYDNSANLIYPLRKTFIYIMIKLIVGELYMNKKDIKRTGIVLGAAAIALVSVTFAGAYAYFTGSVVKLNEENKTTTITANELSNLTLTGDTVLDNSNMIPGEKAIKNITITNQNSYSLCTSLEIDNVINTFVNQNDVTIVLYDGEVEVGEAVFPQTSYTATLDNLNIPANTSKNYRLEIIYNNSAVDQSADMGKTLSGTIKATPSNSCN